MSATSSITRGFAVCMPGEMVLGRTYRETLDEAVAVLFVGPIAETLWAEKQRLGWSVKPVIAFIDIAPAEKALEGTPRRCDTNQVGGMGECLACDAAQGEHCQSLAATTPLHLENDDNG